jgi:2-oxoglutarate dehydrogenase E2 component (dihydrolipoamide succinyltransferase)
VTKLFAQEKQKVDVGADFLEYDTEGKGVETSPKKEAPADKKEEPKKEVQAPKEERKEAPKQPEPSKPREEPVKQQKDSKPAEKKPAAPHVPVVQFSGSRNQRREPMKRIRQRIAERLKGSQNTYATLTTFNELDMSEVMTMRNQFQEEFNKKYGIKLGFMSFFLKAASMALQENPTVNAVIDGEDIIYRDYIDISVAVATPGGLMVPIIRNCETKGLHDFELILRDLSIAARDNKISLEDLTGGTFTISNGGVYGSMLGTPIINPPQTAILGMHNIVNRAVVRGNEIVARPMMYLALSYDHRLIDGRDGVLFLKRIRDLVEEPRKMLMNI